MRQLSFSERLLPRRSGQGQSRRAKSRRALTERWRRRAPKLALVLGCVGLCLFGTLWLAQPGRIASIGEGLWAVVAQAGAGLGMTVQNVYSEGHDTVQPGVLLETLAVARGDPILGFDPRAARARLEAVGWVKSATVERRLPDTIFVRIIERQPLAFWQHDGRITLVDREGVEIGTGEVTRFAELPLIVGAGASAEAPALFDVMASEPDLFARVVSAIRVGERRWNLRFDTGLDAYLPEGDLEIAWLRLSEIIHSRRLFERPVVVLDLRLIDRATLRLAPARDSKHTT
jgi:cell division protein FtsQ